MVLYSGEKAFICSSAEVRIDVGEGVLGASLAIPVFSQRLSAFLLALLVQAVAIMIRWLAKHFGRNRQWGDIPSDIPVTLNQLAISNAIPSPYVVMGGDLNAFVATYQILVIMILALVLTVALWLLLTFAPNPPLYVVWFNTYIGIGLGTLVFSSFWLIWTLATL